MTDNLRCRFSGWCRCWSSAGSEKVTLRLLRVRRASPGGAADGTSSGCGALLLEARVIVIGCAAVRGGRCPLLPPARRARRRRSPRRCDSANDQPGALPTKRHSMSFQAHERVAPHMMPLTAAARLATWNFGYIGSRSDLLVQSGNTLISVVPAPRRRRRCRRQPELPLLTV